MENKKLYIQILLLTITSIFVSLLFLPFAWAGSEKNQLTFINQSGEEALVKLVGPSFKNVEVPNGGKKTVHIAAGEYRIYVRYGKGPSYRYAKGEVFKVKDTASSYTIAELTLHGVINGNYHTYGSSENEFNSQ